MSGNRRAQYVSIPMGPGVLSNTTGRGARTRINYMNWDRWKNASWVRWHKLLAEMQGGWQYQALTAAGVAINPIPGSPLLLLHFDPVVSPVNVALLLHFDGANGQTSTIDSSFYANPVTIAVGNLSTAAPKFGPSAYAVPLHNFLGGYALKVPFTYGSPLDIFATPTWTIEFFVAVTFNASSSFPFIAVAYAGNADGPAVDGFVVSLLDNNDGTVTLSVDPTELFFAGHTFNQTFAVVEGSWHHVALVQNNGFGNAYFDGVALAGTALNWTPANYTPSPFVVAPHGPNVIVGSGIQLSGNGGVGQVDELRVSPVAVYTANFTPPNAPLSSTVNAPVLNATVDSSVYAWPVTLNPSFCALTTATPKFGSGSLQLFDGINTFTSFACAIPFAAAGPLDIFRLQGWTIEFFFMANQNVAARACWLMNYGGRKAQPETSQFLIYIAGDGAGNFSVIVQNNNMFPSSSGQSISQAYAMPTGVWHHLAVVLSAGIVKVYVDGVAMVGSNPNWTPANYVNGNPDLNVIIGSNTLLNDFADGALVDEVIVSNSAIYTANFTPPAAPSTYGLPNTTGSASFPNGLLPGTYLGLARDLHDWSSIDGQFWVAIGTHVKLYVVNQATLYDITPTRSTSNVVNALSTQVGSSLVTVTDAGHKAATGDYVDITGATTVGGLIVNGGYQVTVLDPDTYTILAATSATGSAIGGGNFSIAYEIGIGLPSNGELLGYGTGVYGAGTYGTPRTPGSGVFARLRTWSLDNYGQDLVASPSDGAIYYWTRNNGPNSRAMILTGAPDGVQRVLVDVQQHVIIALGCTDVTSAFNAMLVRWCSFDDITDWVPTDLNTAGDTILASGSRIITGLKTKGQNLIFTDTTLYRMVFVGQPDVYDFIPAGQVVIVGPNAAVDVDGVGYFMGFDNFYNYAGTLNVQGCDVWESVFDPNISTSLLRTQAEKVICYTYEPKTEVTWIYPSIGGSGECDRYVTFNWEDGSWYFGDWNRTCAMGRSPAMGGYPYGVNGGYLYQHEIGTDAVEYSGTTAIPFFMESLDITVGGAKSEYTMGGSDARFAIGGSDSHLLIRSMLPDWKYLAGTLNLTLFTKDRPQDAAYVQEGPVPFDVTTTEIDIDAHGSQVVIRLDNLTAQGGQPALGCKFRMGIWQGLATPYAKR